MFNGEHTERVLDNKHLQVTTVKYTSTYRRHRNELVDQREFVLMNGWMMTSSTLQATSWEPRMNFRKFLSVFL